ncbi:MAG: nuclear transport factor 2 family protein [Variovorax sp.]
MIGDPIVMPGRIEDEAACARLCVDFANNLDARRYQQVLDLFAEDGTLDRMGTAFVGRQEIGRFLASRPTGVTTRHLCTNIRVIFDNEAHAVGSCYVLFFQGTGDEGTPKMSQAPSVVEYHDRFKRTGAGWKIQERRIRMAIQA